VTFAPIYGSSGLHVQYKLLPHLDTRRQGPVSAKNLSIPLGLPETQDTASNCIWHPTGNSEERRFSIGFQRHRDRKAGCKPALRNVAIWRGA
jgi:hypothetical protein